MAEVLALQYPEMNLKQNSHLLTYNLNRVGRTNNVIKMSLFADDVCELLLLNDKRSFQLHLLEAC